MGWAANSVFALPPDVVDSTTYTTAEVVAGEVGSSFNVNTVAEWKPVPAASNLAAGTVTSVSLKPGHTAKVGTVLYSVNLRPVVAAKGSIPAFRAMTFGERGADIAQLQAFLNALGFYRGAIDGAFGGGTEVAVRAWQKSMSAESTGTVELGDLVFLAHLPARLTLDAKVISRGSSVSGGEAAISALPTAPTFHVPVTSAQAAKMPNDTRVEIAGPDRHRWVAVVVDQQSQDESDDIDVILGGLDDTAICAPDCSSIPVSDQSVLPSKVVTLESMSGLTVPSAALVAKPDGTIVVIDPKGAEHPVTLVASANGISLITGVSEGQKVRVPAGGL